MKGDSVMSINGLSDKTLERNFIAKSLHLISIYESVKQKQHPTICFLKDFYDTYNIKRQTFLKYYNRYKQNGKTSSLLPQKRGPKWKSRRPIPFIENKVIDLRLLGNNKYEISLSLKPILKQFTPSPSGVYNICKRHGLNRLNKKIKQTKRKIIKQKAGELAHIDCHHLSKYTVKNYSKKLYIVALLDDCTRIVDAEVVDNIKALTVMFATIKMFKIFKESYNIKFAEILSDNGKEFGNKNSKNKDNHPFEYFLKYVGVKHRYTMPYRPQTNGKIERFWKTLEEDLLQDYQFETIEDLKEELLHYIYYYNHERPHQGINNDTPFNFNKNCQRIT